MRTKRSKTQNRRSRLSCEKLEERRLLAIVWANEFNANNNLSAYGAFEDEARGVIHRAIDEWNRLLTDFNYSGPDGAGNAGGNEFLVDFFVQDFGDQTSGRLTGLTVDAAGKPTRTLISDGHGIQLDIRDWYFDPQPDSDSEFEDVEDGFHDGFSANDGPAFSDFFTTVLHELGHSIGMTEQGGTALSGFLTLNDQGTADPSDDTRTFSGPDGFSAELGGTTGAHFDSGTHPNDLLNPGTGPERRRLISPLDVAILRSAYGYTVSDPVNSLYAGVDDSRTLVVRGVEGDNEDHVIVLWGENDVTVTVNGFIETFPTFNIDQVRISTFGGDDQIEVIFTFPPFLDGVEVFAGDGEDALLLDSDSWTPDAVVYTGLNDDEGIVEIFGIFPGGIPDVAIEFDGVNALETSIETTSLIVVPGDSLGHTIAVFDSTTANNGKVNIFWDELLEITASEFAALTIEGSSQADEIELDTIDPGLAGISVSVNAGDGTDSLTVSEEFRVKKVRLGGGVGADQYDASFVGNGDRRIIIADESDDANVAIVYGTQSGDSIKVFPLSLGAEEVTFSNNAETGSGKFQSISVMGRGGDDIFWLSADSKVLGGVNVTPYTLRGGVGRDKVTAFDQLNPNDDQYVVEPSPTAALPERSAFRRSRLSEGTVDAAAATYFDGVEIFVLHAGTGSNHITVTPSQTTEMLFNANLPAAPLAGVKGDQLEVKFAGTQGRKLTFTNRPNGDGKWSFANRRPITFTSVEKLNYFDVMAVSSDAGATSQPLVRLLDAETAEQQGTPIVAYATDYRQGVRTAIGDLTGDGIPELITAPGRNASPTVKVFDILTGVELPAYRTQAYQASFVNGLTVAVGDIDNDGRNDIVTVPSRGIAQVKVFRNTTGTSADPITDVPYRDFYAFPMSFIGGASVALGNLNAANDNLEIIVASGSGIRATVNVFDTTQFAATGSPVVSPPVFRQYLPFDSTFKGGVSLAVGNVTGDGQLDIVVGAGLSGDGRVQAIDGRFGGVPTTANSRTYRVFTDSGANSQVRVGLNDSDGDGFDEIIAAQSVDGRSGNKIRRVRAVDAAITDMFTETNPAFTGLLLSTSTRKRI